ncbi:hypothetical protein Q6293_05105, partial [Klebsiella pneumoniae]|uniref:hypothetical protein n=1 Tax=Klebsiella pneumoniae TaxID=573 RepID=UPI00272F70E9
TDGDGSHGSTSKTPSYTKSVSWHHYQQDGFIFIKLKPFGNLLATTAFISVHMLADMYNDISGSTSKIYQ